MKKSKNHQTYEINSLCKSVKSWLIPVVEQKIKNMLTRGVHGVYVVFEF